MVTPAPPNSNAKCYPSILRTWKATVSIIKKQNLTKPKPLLLMLTLQLF